MSLFPLKFTSQPHTQFNSKLQLQFIYSHIHYAVPYKHYVTFSWVCIHHFNTLHSTALGTIMLWCLQFTSLGKWYKSQDPHMIPISNNGTLHMRMTSRTMYHLNIGQF